jgi:hypothetical protein
MQSLYQVYSFPPFKGKSLSLICGALKWLVDGEERDKARIEAVLAGELPPSALEPEPGATSALNGSGKEKGDAPATDSTTATTQGIKVGYLRKSAVKCFNM